MASRKGYTFSQITGKNVDKIVKLDEELCKFLNKKYVYNPEIYKWRKIHIDEMKDEGVFICELNDEPVGYISVCYYHVVDHKRPDDDIGIISDIYVMPEHQNGFNAYQLLQLGLGALIENGKNRAIMNVQEDNENHYLHFAIADKLLEQEECTRANGSKTMDYTLLIEDVKALKDLSYKEFMRRIVNEKSKKEEFVK